MEQNNELKEAIANAENIARTGTKHEREDFVAWACAALGFYSSQPGAENARRAKFVEAQYRAYLAAYQATKAGKNA